MYARRQLRAHVRLLHAGGSEAEESKTLEEASDPQLTENRQSHAENGEAS